MREVQKERSLAEIVERFSLPAIAFSGGRDSGFLVWFIKNRLQRDAVILCADHALMPEGEKKYRQEVSRIYGWSYEEFFVDVLRSQEVSSNFPDRCYACKKMLMSAMLERAMALGCDVLFDGTTADERLQYRPGMRALKELGVYSPLAEAGWTKQDVQKSALSFGLTFADKPSESCLATRFPYNQKLSIELIKAVDLFEQKLKSVIEGTVRARVHPSDRLIRIEADQKQAQILFLPYVREELLRLARDLGFNWVTVDIEGFRSGSWDTVYGSVEEER